MSRYTPYENVPDGALLPAIMATTSVNDTRVEFVEPTKWVQRQREATGQVPSTDEAGASSSGSSLVALIPGVASDGVTVRSRPRPRR